MGAYKYFADQCNENDIPDIVEPDADEDGLINDCDGCRSDPDRVAPGNCGCGTLDEGDGDQDSVLDCVDQCPGVDDAVFAPECREAIPAASA